VPVKRNISNNQKRVVSVLPKTGIEFLKNYNHCEYLLNIHHNALADMPFIQLFALTPDTTFG
jgi:hypothetical protein